MRKLSDLIKDLKNEQRKLPMQTTAALTVLGFEIQEKAQDMIGRHQLFWKDLTESTIDQKKRKGWGRFDDPTSPLYATGKYHDSVQYRLVGRNKVQIFSDDPVAEFMEYGTSRGVPPRPVFLPAAKLVLKEWLGKSKLQGFFLKSLK